VVTSKVEALGCMAATLSATAAVPDLSSSASGNLTSAGKWGWERMVAGLCNSCQNSAVDACRAPCFGRQPVREIKLRQKGQVSLENCLLGLSLYEQLTQIG
jgi:hypothetical protein